MASPTTSGSRETLWAIIGSLVVSLILATIMVGNPFRALGAAYFDYSHAPGSAATAPAVAPAAPK